MFKLFRAFFLILFLVSTTTAVYSETSWITKKTDKNKVELEKEEKEKKEKKKKWIAKKKEKKKKNKKKLKEKIKESKSWITKKSKDKLNEIKKNLKKHRTLDNIQAELYFAAMIDPGEDQEGLYLYGYINSDKKSDKSKKFKFNNTSYYSLNDGIAYFDDGKTTCQADMQKGVLFKDLKGKIIITCKNKKVIGASIDFANDGKSGNGDGEYTNGTEYTKVEFEFYTKKKEAIAKLSSFKKNHDILRAQTPDVTGVIVKPNGKYYALLIGNSSYVNWASLKSPKNDVKEIDKILNTQYNFEEVITIINGTEKEIMKGFKKLSKLTTDKDYVLIYYSGHGDNRGKSNYWIPVDGEKDYGLGDWINTAEIMNYILDEIPNHHIVLMSDSCYFDVKTKGMNKPDERKSMAYEKLLKRRAMFIGQSGSNEPVLDSSGGDHSMYAKSFINSLKDNESIIKMTDIFREIDLSHSGMRQQPDWARVKGWGDTGGDFLFIIKK